MDARIQELWDREQIRQCLTRYCRGADRSDAAILRSAFHDDGLIEHGKFVGTPDEFVAWAGPLHAAALSTQHCILNMTCEIDGQTAHAETYFMFARMNPAGKPLTLNGGRYIDRLENRDGAWRIAARMTLRDWAMLDTIPDWSDLAAMTSTAADLSPEARAFMNRGRPSVRGPADPSYDRPLTVDPDRREQYIALAAAET